MPNSLELHRLVLGILKVIILEWVTVPWALPNPGIKSRSPTLQVDSLLSELPGKPIWDYYMELK